MRIQGGSEETISFFIKQSDFINEGDLQKYDSMLTKREVRTFDELAKKAKAEMAKFVTSRKGKEKVGEPSMTKEVLEVEIEERSKGEKVDPHVDNVREDDDEKIFS